MCGHARIIQNIIICLYKKHNEILFFDNFPRALMSSLLGFVPVGFSKDNMFNVWQRKEKWKNLYFCYKPLVTPAVIEILVNMQIPFP